MGNAKVAKNELILKRRKRKRTRKFILILVFLASILTTLCLKLPYFNISQIKVSGNKSVSSEEIIKLSNVYKGNNIFYINVQQGEQGVYRNPYIQKVVIRRKLPHELDIEVTERKAAFYNSVDGKYIIVDHNGIVLEKANSIAGRELVKLDGVNFKAAETGKVVPCDDKRKVQLIGKITDLILLNRSGIKFDSVEMNEITDIKVYCKNICIKLGNSDNLDDKLNKAVNIYNTEELKDSKGYIDVSYKGYPVFFIEK